MYVFIGADGRTCGAEGIYGVKTVPPTFPFGNIHMEMDSGAPNTRSQSKDGNIFSTSQSSKTVISVIISALDRISSNAENFICSLFLSLNAQNHPKAANGLAKGKRESTKDGNIFL